jgi:hypothetical protein
MLSLETTKRLILERKCLFSTISLVPEECVVSRNQFPKLYLGEYSVDESRLIGNLICQIPELFLYGNEFIRDQIKRFMEIVIRNGQIHNEEFVHRYIHEFWGDIDRSNLHSIEFSESYYKGQSWDLQSDFYDLFVRKVVAGNDHLPDIIAYSSNNGGTAWLIEIKKDSIDDRALGQILRYYHRGRVIADRNRFGVGIKNVVPVIICHQGSLTFWDAIPFHFREILEILFYRVDNSGRIKLIDGKTSLRNSASERVWGSL